MSPEIVSNGREQSNGAFPDELPAVKDLSSDFSYLLNGYNVNRYRVNLAIEYAEYLKGRFEPGVYSTSDPEYAESQILPRLYLDTLVQTARRNAYNSLVKRAGDKQAPHTIPALLDLIQSKLDLQKDITDYVEMNTDKTGLALFGNLVQITHHSRRILYGDQVTQEQAREDSLTHLSAILAEYKVLAAIREDWPLATFGSVEQDKAGADIIIPSPTRPQRGVALQVKSSRDANCELSIRDKYVPIPIVRVPMDPERHNPMRLSGEHSLTLKRFVDGAPRYRIAFAA